MNGQEAAAEVTERAIRFLEAISAQDSCRRCGAGVTRDTSDEIRVVHEGRVCMRRRLCGSCMVKWLYWLDEVDRKNAEDADLTG